METPRQTSIPSLVRVKPGALDRIGIYAERQGFKRVVVFISEGLPEALLTRLRVALSSTGVQILTEGEITEISLDHATQRLSGLPRDVDAILGLGGGKALDVAKYVAFLAQLPYVAIPTSLSNDGFCSPQSSLTVDGHRRSLPAAVPRGVVVDTAVCLGAPLALWHSGVGDLAAKMTAVADWKLAFHAVGTPVDDFAALLSDASVYQFMARPQRDLEGMKLLGSALLLNGIAISICGSSRPASGSEHLISHALDGLSQRPRLHGLQVGVATYLISRLQENHSEAIAELFTATGFWEAIAADPFDRGEWREAVRMAPSIKTDFFTILSVKDWLPEIERLLISDRFLARCFNP